MPLRIIAGMLLASTMICAGAAADDWPAYKHDAARSAVTTAQLEFPLHPRFIYQAAQPPRPAWPEPGRSLNRLDFDYAFQPVVAEGLLFFGSSADDSVRALDAATGATRWRFTAGGPVRFAPQIAGDRCYFAADDGFAYCLNAVTGREIWRFAAADDPRLIVGNGRLISRQPCRGGVLVRDGVVYVTAGVWPNEGVLIHALDAQSGRPLWCNDTSSYGYIEYPHAPSVSFGGPAPQGYLLSAEDVLVAPTGRSNPAAFETKTGKLLYYHSGPGFDHKGGTWATIAQNTIFYTAVGWQPDQVVRRGEGVAQPTDSLTALALRTGREEWAPMESLKQAAPEWRQPRWRGQISVGLLGRQRAVFTDDRFFALGNGKVDAWQVHDNQVRLLWSAEHANVYSEALAGDALLVGGDGTITAFAADDGRQLWQAELAGQVRGIAVAQGRLYASTSLGGIYCWDANVAELVRVQTPPQNANVAELVRVQAPPPSDLAEVLRLQLRVEQLLRQMTDSASRRGFALVVGEPDARLAQALAERTQMHVVALLNESQVAPERQRLLDESQLYGTRVVVHPLPAPNPRGQRDLPLPSYCINLMVVSGTASEVAGAELYRVLRPCGGRMAMLDPTRARQIIAQAEIPASEIVAAPADSAVALVKRGKLPGAFDWDSDEPVDHRVRWPLEFLWYGGPNSELMKARHARPRTPLLAAGRCFVFGESHIVAVDAYSGTELWRRRLGTSIGASDSVAADDTHLYVHHRNFVAQFDADTGRLLKIFTDSRVEAPPVYDARQSLHFPTSERDGHSGLLEIRSTDEHLELTLVSESPEPSRNDCWELGFDFRPAEQRLVPGGSGAFDCVVDCRLASLRPIDSDPPLPIDVQERQTTNRSRQIVLRIAWDDVECLLGHRPKDFTLAADLKLWTESMALKLWARPLTDGKPRLLNEAEATITLTDPATTQSVLDLVPIASRRELPRHAQTEGPLPPLVLRRNDERGRDSGPWPTRLPGWELATRLQPLTGLEGPREYMRSYGCNGIICSATMDFFRSGSIGMYDRQDDSGMRNIAGIRAGCGTTTVPALGLLVYTESASDCNCTYNLATSFAMAPAERRRNEDWAMFHDGHLAPRQIRRSSLNLGAPGDRRDDQHELWLHFPRQPLAVAKGYTIRLPYQLEAVEGFGPYHVNTDRRTIENTERPWIYGSGIKGLRRLSMDLAFYQPQQTCLLVPSEDQPRIDGELDDVCWDGFAAIPVPEQRANIHLRQDADKLYVAYERSAVYDRRGQMTPWRVGTTGEDAEVERDDHFRLYFGNEDSPRIASFAIAAGGGRRQSRLDYDLQVGRLEGIAIDARFDDWTADGTASLKLDLPQEAALRVGWSEQGLALLLEVPTDFQVERGLYGISLLLSADGQRYQQLTVDPRQSRVRADAWNGEDVATVTMRQASAAAEGWMRVEALAPWSSLGVTAEEGRRLGLAIRLFDPSESFFNAERPVPWTAQRHRQSALHMYKRFHLVLAPSADRRAVKTYQRYGHEGYALFDLGADLREDRTWQAPWTSRTKADDKSFRAELAIPWSTLAMAGVSRDRLRVEATSRVRWGGRQEDVLRDIDRLATEVHSHDLPHSEETYTIRLHFAELDDVAAGERRFDVKLQGHVVLEDFDVAQAAGGPNRAVVREFTGIQAGNRLELELSPKSELPTAGTETILSGVELIAVPGLPRQ